MIRIILNEQDFRDLVAGRIARPAAHDMRASHAVDVEIALSDIGWVRMMKLIREAAGETEG